MLHGRLLGGLAPRALDVAIGLEGWRAARLTVDLFRPAAMAPETDPSDADAWWLRVVQGGFGTGEQTRVWTRETACLVDDEPVSPLVRTALSGDLACPLANSSDEGLHHINADYTMLIGRYPVGEWVGPDVAQQIDADGVSIGSATLVDRTVRSRRAEVRHWRGLRWTRRHRFR